MDGKNTARRLARPEVLAVAVPVAVMLGIGLWRLDRGGMWGDEAATFLVGRRTVPQIWRMLHSVDAVHGLYYLVLHVVLAVRPDEVALRLPSVCGAAVSAGLVGALGMRLAGPRVGLWSGLLYAVTPLIGHYAQEGRSYAIVSAGVIGATLLLVTGLGRSGRAGRVWAGYGGVLAVTCVLHELAVLVVCAHAVTLLLARAPGRVWTGWGRAVGVVTVVLAPLVWLSHGQAGQVGWLVAPDWEKAEALVRAVAAGPTGMVFRMCVLLAVAGAVRVRRVARVAVPLLVLPPTLLMTASQVQPLYHERYVLYAFAGAPLLVAAGGEWLAGALAGMGPGRGVPNLPHARGHLGEETASAERNDRDGLRRLLGRHVSFAGGVRGPRAVPADDGQSRISSPAGVLLADHRDPQPDHPHPHPRPVLRRPLSRRPLLTLAGVLAVGLVAVHDLPLYRHDRSPAHRPENLAAVTGLAARDIRPGDPVLFVPAFWRIAESAYPGGFGKARDIALKESGARSGTLSGEEVGVRELSARLAGVDRVWVVGDGRVLGARRPPPRSPVERAKLAALEGQFMPRWQYRSGRVTLRLYLRRTRATRLAPMNGLAAPTGLLPSPPPRPRPARS
ncbi:glycosyltransferase family 39 protein [Streptomyces sp. NPDC006476]|uniref:glycosyltransferase family 39 protein n=1 Tax=Streptomyces sp. NPDC006476 TaxID=3157175 RepID=UPI0033AC431B